MLFAIVSIPGHAAPAPTVIRVVLDDNYPPYIFRDSGGQIQGILKDLWDLWQQRTGVTVDFRPMDWGKARAIMESGQADVIDTIFETEERRKIYEFSRPYATIEVPIVFHQSIGGITDAASLKGFAVGVKDGDACVEYLKAHRIADLKFYASYEAEVKAAIRREIRVLCIDKPAAYYFFNREGAADEFRYSPPLYMGELHWAVAKGKADLKHLVEEGFSRITADERAAIETRWLGKKLADGIWPGIASYGGYALLAVALVIAMLFAWNWTLRRRVAASTAELGMANCSLREGAEKLRLFADNVPAMTVSYDENLRCRFANKGFAEFFGFSVENVLGKHLREIVGEDNYSEIEGHFLQVLRGHPVTFQRMRKRQNGEILCLETKLLPHIGDHGKVLGCYSVASDITEHKQAEERIQRVAHHDSLTGLPNRLLFNDRLNQAVSLAKRDSRQFALLYLDLDRFKPVNDTLGHTAGDQLLQAVAARIRREVRESDTVARVGGDEFAVILPDIARREEAETVARKIIAALATPFQLDSQKQSISIGTSIGIALYPSDAQDADALIKAADAAMYGAKQARSGYRFFGT